MSFRKTWDKEYYEAKAKQRLENGGEDLEVDKNLSKTKISQREEFMSASNDAVGPAGSQRAFLKARENKLDLESKAGKIELYTPNLGETRRGASGPGYHCEVCNCILKDSASYLDHVNGKKHLRALGFSMRVEKSGSDQVKSRIETIKRKLEDEKHTTKTSAIEDHDSKIARQLADDELRKKQKKAAEDLKKQVIKSEEEDYVDPEIAALLGFGSFSSSKR